MKKILYILTAALVALTACTKEIEWNRLSMTDEPDAVYPEGATIELTFGVPMPPQTKGEMGDDPEIDDLHVAVFDGSGSLKQYELAEYDPVESNGSAGMQFFKVELKLRSSEARIHFIANGPKKEEVTGGMESSLMQEWTTAYSNAAYWQRIVLPEGITAYSFSAKNGDAYWTGDGNEVLNFYYIDNGDNTYTHISKSAYDENHGSDKRYMVYHALISLDGGRAHYTDFNNRVVNVGDFVNARGDKILDGTGYFQSASITDAVASVPLVRNFARIKVKKAATAGNFEPVEYYLMNIPDKGTIAPYSAEVGGFVPQYSVSRYVKNTESGMMELVSGDPEVFTYVEDYTPAEGQKTGYEKLLESLNASGYTADMPTSAKLIQTAAEVEANVVDNKPAIPTTWQKYKVKVGANNATVDETPSAFVFERGLPNKGLEPLYLLMGGYLNGNKDEMRWFKVELTDATGKYMRIFRDVTYFLEIGQIDGSEGYGSAAEAAVGESVSDVSNSTATEDLLEISDGKGTSMAVSYIDYVSMESRADEDPGYGEKKRILFKVFDSNSSERTALSPTIGEGDAAPSRYTLEFENDDVSNPAIASFTMGTSAVTGPDGKSDWQYADVQLYGSPSNGILHGTLTIAGVTTAGNTSGKTLSRKVKYHVMSTPRLTLSAEKLPSEKNGEQTALKISLQEGLGSSLFPLVLKIEAEKANLVPDVSANSVDLPVETGTSYFNGANTFCFLFTLNYTDYYDKSNKTKPFTTDFTLYFKTTKDYSGQGATGSNETWFSVTDKNGRFFYKPKDEADLYNDRTSGAVDPHVNYAVTPLLVTNGNKFFSVTPATQTVPAEATSAMFAVKTNSTTTWSASGTGVFFDADYTVTSLTNQAGNQVVTVYFNKNTDATAKNYDITFTPATGMGQGQTVTVTQQKVLEHHTGTYTLALNNSDNYNTDSFTQNNSGTRIVFENSEGYRTLNWGRYTYLGKYLGYGDWYYNEYYDGSITITAPTGGNRVNGKITKITITYYNDQNTQTVTYNPTATSSSKTQWTGSADTVTITMACSSYNQYQSRNVVSNIAVEYEYDD